LRPRPRGSPIHARTTIAVVHDWLDTWAGGEICLEQILAIFPQATLFALIDVFPPALRARIGGRHAITSFLQHLPGAKTHFRRLLPLFPRAIESLDVSRFDVVISSSHAVAKGVRTHRGQLHVCYCYSPMRYAWDLRDQYLAQVRLDRGLRGWAATRLLDRIAAWDRRTSVRVDDFVAISHHIRDRIARCYSREASVIYPPVTLPAFAGRPGGNRRYVTVSRLVPYKVIDVLAAAFARLPGRELIVVGEGPERARIAASAGANVTLAGQADDARRDEILRSADAFLFAAEEDFGIAPLEAQGAGLPVIAYARGGVTETIRGLDDPWPTGVFFDAQTPEAVADAVLRFEANAHRFDAAECRRNAERFGVERFRREFGEHVAARYEQFRGRKLE
jgi:glycosyltransferase involved in cell wall biosynthesis